MTVSAHLVVMAKAPRPGRVKTRLQPAYRPEEAAALADAALRDTLDAVRSSDVDRRIVALDGPPGPWLGHGLDVVPQVAGSLNRRLAASWAYAGGPGIQIGMDTPQLTSALLDDAIGQLLEPGVDAVLGLARDGGWWAVGFRTPAAGAFAGVPMSRADTGARQYERLSQLGLRTALLPELRDMDRVADVAAISDGHPHLRTAALARAFGPRG